MRRRLKLRPSGRFEYRPRQEIVKTNNYSTVQIPRCAWAQREDSGENSASRGEKRETRGRRTKKKKGEGRTRRRSDGVINDRVFNTLYGLAYKLRAVHRSSWQRINGRGAEHEADLSLSLSLPLHFFRPYLPFNVTDLPLSFSLPCLSASTCSSGLLFRGSLPSLPFIHPFSRIPLTDVARMRTGR